MRKRIIGTGGRGHGADGDEWWDLEQVASVELSSEAEGHPVESALIPGRDGDWLAAGAGPQTIRLHFNEPRRVRRIGLRFVERDTGRTQEFVLRWVSAGQPAREVVRQQWTFSPGGSTEEVENYRVDLPEVTVLELTIIPDITGGDARASLAQMRVA